MLGKLFNGIIALFAGVDTKTLFKWATFIFTTLKGRNDNTFNMDADRIIQLLGRNEVSTEGSVTENELRVLESFGGSLGYMDSRHLAQAGKEIIAILKERDDNTLFHDADKADTLIAQNTIS